MMSFNWVDLDEIYERMKNYEAYLSIHSFSKGREKVDDTAIHNSHTTSACALSLDNNPLRLRREMIMNNDCGGDQQTQYYVFV